MTSDGITKSDWDKLRALAAQLANAACADDKVLYNRYREDLLEYLNQLKAKYGDLPSIIATQADYTNRVREKKRLLKRALRRAEEIDDLKNQILIAESLEEFHKEEVLDRAEAAAWRRKAVLLNLRAKKLNRGGGNLSNIGIQRNARKDASLLCRRNGICRNSFMPLFSPSIWSFG